MTRIFSIPRIDLDLRNERLGMILDRNSKFDSDSIQSTREFAIGCPRMLCASYLRQLGMGADARELTKAFVIVLAALKLHAPAMAQWPDEMASLSVDELRAFEERGNMFAQFNLAFRYASGEGVPENDAEAVKWRRLAAEQGNRSMRMSMLSCVNSSTTLSMRYVLPSWVRSSTILRVGVN
jgi:TPR repeat protein